MRVGLLSDIHGNLDALRVVLEIFARERVDFIACMGDTVGYGAQPDECCSLIRRVADVVVLGNHDAAVAGRMDYSYYRPAARNALDLHARLLSTSNMRWLRSLPLIHREGEMAFCHGSPTGLEEFDYIFVLEQMGDLVARFEEQSTVTFIGHSHLCKCFSFDIEGAEEVLNTRFSLDPERKYLLTSGSVGQPRDYDTRTCCAVFDTTTRRFEYHRHVYDVAAAAQKIFSTDLSVAFGKRLFLGV